MAPNTVKHHAGEDPGRDLRPRRGHRGYRHRHLPGVQRFLPDAIAEQGISYQDVVEQLETEGLDKFDKSWTELLETVRTALTTPADSLTAHPPARIAPTRRLAMSLTVIVCGRRCASGH